MSLQTLLITSIRSTQPNVTTQHIYLLLYYGVISVLEWSHMIYMLTFSVRKCLVLEQNTNMLNSNKQQESYI